jgi:DNA-binding beta-propeller fold protein YncE
VIAIQQTSRVLLCVALLAANATALADETPQERCTRYAQRAVEQFQIANTHAGCGVVPDPFRWHANYQGHFTGCLIAPPQVAADQEQKRDELLRMCGALSQGGTTTAVAAPSPVPQTAAAPAQPAAQAVVKAATDTTSRPSAAPAAAERGPRTWPRGTRLYAMSNTGGDQLITSFDTASGTQVGTTMKGRHCADCRGLAVNAAGVAFSQATSFVAMWAPDGTVRGLKIPLHSFNSVVDAATATAYGLDLNPSDPKQILPFDENAKVARYAISNGVSASMYMTLDDEGNFYMLRGTSVDVYDANGRLKVAKWLPAPTYPNGIAASPNGRIYISWIGKVQAYDKQAQPVGEAIVLRDARGFALDPQNLAIDADGKVYVVYSASGGVSWVIAYDAQGQRAGNLITPPNMVRGIALQ